GEHGGLEADVGGVSHAVEDDGDGLGPDRGAGSEAGGASGGEDAEACFAGDAAALVEDPADRAGGEAGLLGEVVDGARGFGLRLAHGIVSGAGSLVGQHLLYSRARPAPSQGPSDAEIPSPARVELVFRRQSNG